MRLVKNSRHKHVQNCSLHSSLINVKSVHKFIIILNTERVTNNFTLKKEAAPDYKVSQLIN